MTTNTNWRSNLSSWVRKHIETTRIAAATAWTDECARPSLVAQLDQLLSTLVYAVTPVDSRAR
jgi:hypothetical protein